MDAAQKMEADNVSQLNQLKTANDNAAGGLSGFAKRKRCQQQSRDDGRKHAQHEKPSEALGGRRGLCGVAGVSAAQAARSITF